MTAPTYHLTGDIEAGAAAALAAFLANNPGPVRVVINSPGGNAAEGAALMAEIERHGQVSVLVLGIAASAATLPMVAALEVTIHPAAMVMIHAPGAWAEGPANAHRAAADALDKISLTYAQAYARHTGHPVETLLRWMQEETWMTADEAVALGFADLVEPTPDAGPLVARADYTRFRSAPDHLRRLAAKHGWATASPANQP